MFCVSVVDGGWRRPPGGWWGLRDCEEIDGGYCSVIACDRGDVMDRRGICRDDYEAFCCVNRRWGNPWARRWSGGASQWIG